jgi:MFS family permease
MAHLAATEAGDRDAGFLQGILLAFVPTTIVAATCAALPILPAIIRAFPSQPNIAQLVPLVAVLPTLTVALASIVAGVVGDKLGRRRLLIISTAVFAITAVLPIWLNSFMLILASRAVMGLAIGVMITSAVALTGDYYSGAILQRWLAAQGGVAAIVGVVVSAVSGALGEIGWRYAFLPLFAGALLFVGLVAVRPPAAATRTIAAEAVEEEGGAAPWAAWACMFGLSIVGVMIVFPPAYELGVLIHEKALGASWVTGVGVAVMAAAAAVASFSLGWLRRLPPPVKAALAIGLGGVGALLIGQSKSLIVLMVGSALDGAGQGMLNPALSMWLLEATPGRWRGSAVGSFTTVTFLTLFAAPLVARSAAVDLGASSAAMRLYAIAGFVVAGALLLGIPIFRRLAAGAASPGSVVPAQQPPAGGG